MVAGWGGGGVGGGVGGEWGREGGEGGGEVGDGREGEGAEWSHTCESAR